MMRGLFILFIFQFLFFCSLRCQETTNSTTEQQLENIADADQTETEDDSYLQLLELYRKTPMNLNTAGENELRELRILNGLQVANFLSYRKLFGNFLTIYELQAIPTWDIVTIKRLQPFVTVSEPLRLEKVFSERFKEGDHTLLVRYSQVLEKSRGFDTSTPGTKYLGSPQKLFFRYRYQYKNLLQFGLVGDKDAGEQFFKGAQHLGFDFYSVHFFARNLGSMKSIALGDFTINMGQGLIQWQSLAFRKSVDVLGIKRQSPVVRPYNSAGEYNFHRGAAVTFEKGRFEATAFISYRKLSANFTADTVSSEEYFSSFQNSGYHRTESEVADRKKLGQFAFGGNLKYRGTNWQVGLNAIQYNFSSTLQKRAEPYNLYAVHGDSWNNLSVDYSYTHRNLHFFGEAAVDKNFYKAFLNGLLISVDPKVDLSFVHRNINSGYQSINGNAFTESTYPTNERGFFSGISIRPFSGWRLDAYADFFKFPWLKYLVDAPSSGKDFVIQLSYVPNRQLEFYLRFKNETKQGNQSDNTTVTNYLVTIPKQNWRTQFSYKISNTFLIRNRTELLWYDRKGESSERGFLTLFDIFYNPLLSRFDGNIRLQYFETNGYDSRIYAYESDVLFYYSIPSFYNKGYRYYLNLNYNLNKHFSVWLKWSQTIYRDQDSIGSGLDEIGGNHKSEIRILTRFTL